MPGNSGQTAHTARRVFFRLPNTDMSDSTSHNSLPVMALNVARNNPDLRSLCDQDGITRYFF